MCWFFQILLVCIFLLPFAVKTQTVYQPKHAKATIQVLKDKVKVGKNGKATVKFTITPKKDWYVYSIKEENGMPISVESSNEELYSIGKLTENPTAKSYYDEGFEANVYRHFSPVTIIVPIKFSKKANLKSVKNIELIVHFQTPSNLYGSCINESLPINIQVISSK